MGDTGKAALRAEALARRDAMSEAERGEKSRRIADAVMRLGEFESAQTALLFASFGSEVDTRPLIHEALRMGKTVALPVVCKSLGELELRAVRNLTSDVRPGTWGILEPTEKCPEIRRSQLDFVLLPGVAFDEQGGRVGYGGGYYDKLLGELKHDGAAPALVAIAFETQIAPRVPMSESDLPVPVIVTDKRVIRCGATDACGQ